MNAPVLRSLMVRRLAGEEFAVAELTHKPAVAGLDFAANCDR